MSLDKHDDSKGYKVYRCLYRVFNYDTHGTVVLSVCFSCVFMIPIGVYLFFH